MSSADKVVCRPAQVQGGAEALRREGRAGTVQLRSRRPHKQGQMAAVQVRLDDRQVSKNVITSWPFLMLATLRRFAQVLPSLWAVDWCMAMLLPLTRSAQCVPPVL